MRSGARPGTGIGPSARRWTVTVLTLLAAGCGSNDGSTRGPPVSDSVYVEVMARLVLLDSLMGSASRDLPDGTSRDSARIRVLRAYDVRGEDLLAFARQRGTRPDRMEAIWRRIYELSDSLGDEGWRPPDPDSAGDVGYGDASP